MLPLLVLGCHAKFKKHAPTLDVVRLQVVTNTGPYVNLGKVHDDSILAAAINTVQVVNEINQTKDMASRLDPAGMSEQLAQGMMQTIQNGPPFELTGDPQANDLLQIEVLEYGLFVPYLGAPGQFTYRVKARLYKANGERVYSTSLSCDTAAGDPSALAVVTGTVNNIRQLKDMSDDELQAAFEDVAHYCGTHFATRMRRHAG